MATGISPTPGSGQEEPRPAACGSPESGRARLGMRPPAGCLRAITDFTHYGYGPKTKENSPGLIVPYYPRSGVSAVQRQSEWTGIRYSFRLTSVL
jgi:hypothetical protein